MKTKNRGISLIVLVVTIIIMIILASVIILALTNNGIINSAREAVQSYQKSDEKNEMQTILADIIVEKDKSGKSNIELIADLKENLKKKDYKVHEYREVILVQRSNTKYEISKENLEMKEKQEDIWDGDTIDNSIFVDYTNKTEFEITTAAQLKAFEVEVNTNKKTFQDKVVKLGEDINYGAKWDKEGKLTKGKSWTPITGFRGVFDGEGHTIAGIHINTTSDNVGLFGAGNSTYTEIKNVGLIDSYIKGNRNIGGIIGTSCKSIENCYSSATIIGLGSIGGIMGHDNGGNTVVNNCYNIGDITGDVTNGIYVGGIYGLSYSGKVAISNSYNEGNIRGNYAGGISRRKWSYIKLL